MRTSIAKLFVKVKLKAKMFQRRDYSKNEICPAI
jgi:hypothetical protein